MATPTDAQLGAGGWAVVALKPSVPVPATVEITPSETLRMRLFEVIGNIEVARPKVHRDACGVVQLSAGGRSVVAGLKPSVPVPATVEITPFETLRMRLFYIVAM